MKIITLCGIFAFSPLTSASVVTLTDDNFEAVTAGKIAFVKFFAPWCGHCKAMASDWEKLAEDYENNEKGIIIAEVDCTIDETEEICDKQNVEGFPTLKYGDSSWMESYEGERSYDALAKFAKDGLKKGCSPVNTELCTEDQKAKIERFMAMSVEELEVIINDIDQKLEEDEDAFDESTDVLEETYTNLVSAADDVKKKAKAAVDYNMLQAVQAFRSEQGGSDEL